MTNSSHESDNTVIDDEHRRQVDENIAGIGADKEFLKLGNSWNEQAITHRYAHNMLWLGRPLMQLPQDIYATHEIIWNVNPDLIIETGIAHGGSLILSASMLALLDYCHSSKEGMPIEPLQTRRRVIGIDIDIRAHNRAAIDAHPLAHFIEMFEGSSISDEVINKVRDRSIQFERCLVFLDSNHTHDHVLSELEAYAPLVSPGSYCVVWDTGIEDLSEGFTPSLDGTERPWGKGNNPKTAVFEYLRLLDKEGRLAEDGNRLRLEIDKKIEHKVAITAAPDGFLRRL